MQHISLKGGTRIHLIPQTVHVLNHEYSEYIRLLEREKKNAHVIELANQQTLK